MRELKYWQPGGKTGTIQADYSSGAHHAIKKHFKTNDVYHIAGSLWMEGKAVFSVDGIETKIFEKR